MSKKKLNSIQEFFEHPGRIKELHRFLNEVDDVCGMYNIPSLSDLYGDFYDELYDVVDEYRNGTSSIFVPGILDKDKSQS